MFLNTSIYSFLNQESQNPQKRAGSVVLMFFLGDCWDSNSQLIEQLVQLIFDRLRLYLNQLSLSYLKAGNVCKMHINQLSPID